MSHEKRGYRALMPVICRIIRWWFAKAVHGPAERCGVISSIFEFQVCALDQSLRQSMLSKQGGPVQCRLSAFPAQVRLCACIQQSDRDVFGTGAAAPMSGVSSLPSLQKSTSAPASRSASMSGNSLPFSSTPLKSMSET